MLAHKKEQASALLTALFIIIIVALLATSTAYKFRLIAHLAELNNTSNQLVLYASGATKQEAINIENYSNAWQQQPPSQMQFVTIPPFISTTTADGTVVHARVVDAMSLFNINNLAYPNTQQNFINLLHIVMPTLSSEQDMQLANNITDWLLPSTNNNSDQLYANFNPPYRAAHQSMLDISELRQVAGMTPAIYNALSPYLVALPIAETGANTSSSTNSNPLSGQPTAININTASAAVLAASSSQMTTEQAEQLYNCRQEHGIFLTMSDLTNACSPNNSIITAGLVVSSNDFIVYSTATHNDQRITMVTLISTEQSNNNNNSNNNSSSSSNNNLKHSYIIWQMLK